jgi:hypothetical protein
MPFAIAPMRLASDPAASSTPERAEKDEGSEARVCSAPANAFTVLSSELELPGWPKSRSISAAKRAFSAV